MKHVLLSLAVLFIAMQSIASGPFQAGTNTHRRHLNPTNGKHLQEASTSERLVAFSEYSNFGVPALNDSQRIVYNNPHAGGGYEQSLAYMYGLFNYVPAYDFILSAFKWDTTYQYSPNGPEHRYSIVRNSNNRFQSMINDTAVGSGWQTANVESYQYNQSGQPDLYYWSPNKRDSFVFDANQNVSWLFSQSNSGVRWVNTSADNYNYDANGRLRYIAFYDTTAGYLTTYEGDSINYDQTGKTIAELTYISNAVYYIDSFFYSAGQLSTILYYQADSAHPHSIDTYGYDAAGSLISKYSSYGPSYSVQNNFYYENYTPAAGISNVSAMDMKLYPDPANDQLHISGAPQNSVVAITSTSGQTLMTQAGPPQGDLLLDISTLSAGIYFVRITDNVDQLLVRKFVKQ